MSGFQRASTAIKVNLELHRCKEQPKTLKLSRSHKWRFTTLALSIVGFAFTVAVFNTHVTSADELPVIQKFGTLSSDETWVAGNVYMVTSTVIVPDTITLTIEEGAIVKYTNHWQNAGLSVEHGGTLNAIGTAQDPIYFTSYKDDSLGGDSNGDGSSTGAPYDYGRAIMAQGGEVNLEHSVVRYGSTAVDVWSGSCQGTPDLVTLKDNIFNNTVYLSACEAGSVALQRNTFDVPDGDYPIEANGIDLNIIQLTGSDKNTFVGSDENVALKVGGSQVPSGATWTVDGGSGLEVVYLNFGIKVDGTLNLNPGSIIKHTNGTNREIDVRHGGTLNAIGTAQDPIYFTSYKDDSLGGDSNGDGSSTGAPYDYGRAIMAQGGEVNLEHSVVRYGSTAVDVWSGSSLSADSITVKDVDVAVSIGGGQVNIANATVIDATRGLEVGGSAEVVFRGSFDNISDKAIQACDWEGDCAVDAAYVDWGSAEGPFPSSSDAMVCGQVWIGPWVYDGSTYNGGLFGSENCSGSPTPEDGMVNGISYFQDGVSIKQIDCDEGFQDACDAINNAMVCLDGALSVAQSQIPWPLPPATTQQEINAFASGTVSAASTYLTSQASQTVTGFGFGLLGHVSGAVDTISTMESAYSSCAP